MKLINKISVSGAFIAALLAAGCNGGTTAAKASSGSAAVAGSDKTVSEESLGLRKTNLYKEDSSTVGVATTYNVKTAGSSDRYKRAFQDAPPMIPHDTEGMLPITKDNNQCITCHVDAAAGDKSIPSVPVSHFTNFRPSSSYAEKGANTSSEKLAHVSIKKLNHLYQGRFNCSQCHAPQANVKPLVANEFTPDYTKKGGEFKSSWNESEFMKGIDTTK